MPGGSRAGGGPPTPGLPPGLVPRNEAERRAVEDVLRKMRQDKKPGERKEFQREEQNRDESATLGAKAHIIVRLPADARLWVDQIECPLPGAVRAFDTPSLDPQQSYAYTLRVAVERNGQLLQDARRVPLTPGQRIEVDFTEVGAVRTASTE